MAHGKGFGWRFPVFAAATHGRQAALIRFLTLLMNIIHRGLHGVMVGGVVLI